MEINRNFNIYDFTSSSSESETSSSSNESTDSEQDDNNKKIKKYKKTKKLKINLNNDLMNDIGNCDKKQNILFKLYNRERTGYFTNSPLNKRKENAFRKVPKRLSFCLKDIVPYCYLKGHVFMGLTVCGQFLLSYKVSYKDESILFSNAYNFNAEIIYELYFWIYRPHHLLGKYFKVVLFDDHGVDNYKIVTMTQWKNNPRTLIVHGASEEDEGNSHVTIVSVPKLGCLDCKKIRDDYSDDYFRCDALCIKCNMTIHTKYSRNESDPKFLPEVNLSCPNYIILNGNGFIHIINIELDVPKIINSKTQITNASASAMQQNSNSYDVGYLNKTELIITSQQNSQSDDLSNGSNSYYLGSSSAASNSNNSNGVGNVVINNGTNGILNMKKISHIEHHYKTAASSTDDSNKLYGCDNHSNSNHKNSIVENILADFAENETNDNLTNFDELIITCNPTTITSASSSIQLKAEIIDDQANSNIKQTTKSNVRLLNHNNRYKHINSFNKIKNRIRMKRSIDQLTTIAGLPSPTSSTTTTTTPSTLNSTSSKQIYEFSEDNEKCEKISIFRKRRLADKKYEFSDYNSENIIPFNINLRKRNINRIYSSVASANSSIVSSLPSTSSSQNLSSQQYNNLNCGLFSTTPPNYEVTSHLHRASPSHGFRSPCGSPVGNRCLRSPPGFSKTTYFNSRSPTYTMRSPTTTTTLTLSPRQQPKKSSNLELLDNTLYPTGFQSPRRTDDFDNLKYGIQLLNENLKSKIDVTDNVCGNKDSDKPVCSKKFVRRFVEEDDATSVITSEEDDCISPGYHTSLPMEVHGSCYSDMQMVSRASYQKLKCPTVIITQNSFDLETFTFHVANHLCNANNKKYDIFYDWACEIIHACPLSCILTLLLMVHFTARDKLPRDATECFYCSSNVDCTSHRKHYQCQTLFTWNIETGDWIVLDYGNLLEVSNKETSGKLNAFARRITNEMTSKLFGNFKFFNHLKILDSCNEKSKDLLKDLQNSIEFYRTSRNMDFVESDISE